MRFRKTRQFDNDLIILPNHIQEAARKQFHLFKQDSRHNSLRVKKMQGFKDVWEGHVTQGYVFTSRPCRESKTDELIAVFRRIGTHAVYDNP